MQFAKLEQWLIPTVIFLMAAGILVVIIGTGTVGQVSAPNKKRMTLTYAPTSLPEHKSLRRRCKGTRGRLSDRESRHLLVNCATMIFEHRSHKERRPSRRKAALEDNRAKKTCRTQRLTARKRESSLPSANLRGASRHRRNKADVDRTLAERARQEALIASESATHQHLEQAIADEPALPSYGDGSARRT